MAREGGYGASPADVALTVAQRNGGPGAPPITELAAAGAKRISTGTAITQAAYALAGRATTELLTKGTYTEMEEALDFGTINNLLAR